MKNPKVLATAMAITATILIILAIIVFGPRQKPTIQTPEKISPLTETVKISVSLPVGNSSCPEGALCNPLVPPGSAQTYGSLESFDKLGTGECYSPRDPKCLVDRSALVNGGLLSTTYSVPAKTYFHIGAVVGNRFNLANIQINGSPVTTFGSLGEKYNMWPVACFIVNDNQTIGTNPNCKAKAYSLRIRVTGGSNTKNPFKDPIAPYTGTQPGEDIRFQTSLWQNPTPDGIWQRMVWDAANSAYTEYFPTVLSDQSAYFVTFHPSRNNYVTTPGKYETGFGVYADVIPFSGGKVLCTSELVHYLDMDPGPGVWPAAVIEGINSNTGCVIQGTDTRAVFLDVYHK